MDGLGVKEVHVGPELVAEAEAGAGPRPARRQVHMGVGPVDVGLAEGDGRPVHGGQGRRHLQGRIMCLGGRSASPSDRAERLESRPGVGSQ